MWVVEQGACCGDSEMGGIIKGKVAPGYEKVVDVFKRSFVRGLEENAQVCAYVKGREVINLVGYLEKTSKTVVSESSSHLSDIILREERYDESSVQNIFSSGKSAGVCSNSDAR